MTERLTARNKDGAYFLGINGKACTDKQGRTYGEAAEKLARYEDLEEQGRLVELPEGFDMKKLVNALGFNYCPTHYGLGEVYCDFMACNDCWEKALKGGAE